MTDAIQGDGLTKQEIHQRKITMIDGTRGGIELHAPTYDDMIVTELSRRGFLDAKHIDAACDYLELKNSVYGFLNVKTMAGILRTGDTGMSREHAEDAYYIACRHLGKNSERVIVAAMNDKADETLSMIMVIEAYRTAFHRVFDAMDLAIRSVKEMIQKELA